MPLLPRRKVKALEETVALTTLKQLVNPTSNITDANTALFGTSLAHDIATKFNLLLNELRSGGVLGRKTSGKETK